MTSLAQADALGVDCLERQVGIGPGAMEAALRRAAALADVVHPGVLKPLEVRQDANGAVIAVMPRLDGHSLAAVLQARGTLRAGECVTVGVGAALALAAMHRAGLAHGDISPANLMVNPSLVSVVDTMAGAMDAELGTQGYAAPERVHGATAPADVYSLGKVLAEAVRDEDKDVIDAWVAPMLASDPSTRPSAAMVARALQACTPALTVHMPALGVAETMRAHALSTALATTRKPEARWWRVRNALVRWGTVAGALTVGATLAMAVGPAVWNAMNPPAQPGFDPPMPVPASAAVAAPVAAAAVTEARFAALAAADAQALLATTVEGSPARESIQPLADSLATGAMRADSVAVTVDEVEVVSSQGRRASAIVTYTVSPHTVTMEGVVTAYDAYTQRVELDLLWSAAGWQVERARLSEP